MTGPHRADGPRRATQPRGATRAARWTPLAVVYLVLAVLGLAGTWTLNVLAVVGGGGFVTEWFSNGPATQSLQVDLLVLAVASGVLIVVEGRRIGMRRAWVFLPLAAITAAAFAVPLFLALRERRLAARIADAAQPAGGSDQSLPNGSPG